MNDELIIQVNENTDLRLDKYIVNNSNLSRTKVKSLFDDNLIFLNNINIDKLNIKVKKNDIITIKTDLYSRNTKITLNPLENLSPVNLPIDIVYFDSEIMIINKPSGLLVYPTQHNEPDTLAHRLANYFISQNIFSNAKEYRYGIVHRLDKDTSGLLIIAKNANMFNLLQEMMLNNQIKRKYIAIVNNCFDSKDFLFKINAPIGRVYSDELKMRVNAPKNLKTAITIVNVLKNISNKFSLVECELLTGRTHQIRVHMQYINHPIYNDPIYGINKHTTKFNQYLYCSHISFYHPINKELININLEMPHEFTDFIKLHEGE